MDESSLDELVTEEEHSTENELVTEEEHNTKEQEPERKRKKGKNIGFNLFTLISQHLTSENSAIKFAQEQKYMPIYAHCPTCGVKLTKIYAQRRKNS